MNVAPEATASTTLDPLFAVEGVRQVLLIRGETVEARQGDGAAPVPPGAGALGRALVQLTKASQGAPRCLVVRGDQGTLVFQFLPSSEGVVVVETNLDADHSHLRVELESLQTLPVLSSPKKAEPPPPVPPRPQPQPSQPQPRSAPSIVTHYRGEVKDAFARVAVVARKHLGPRVVATYFRASKPTELDGYRVADDSSLVAEEGRLTTEEVALLILWLASFTRRATKIVLDFDVQVRTALGDSGAWLLPGSVAEGSRSS